MSYTIYAPIWIPVAERLPEGKGNVLAVSRGGLIQMELAGVVRACSNPERGVMQITHWMPLPPPPDSSLTKGSEHGKEH